MKKTVIAVLLLLLPVAAFAKEPEERFERGTWDINVGLNSVNSTLSAGIGYFFVKDLEGIVNADYRVVDVSGSGAKEKDEFGGVGLNLIYNIPTGQPIIPIIGAGIAYNHQRLQISGTGLTKSDTQTDTFVTSVLAGVRLLVGEVGSVNLSGTLGYGSVKVADLSLSGAVYGFQLSYSVFFK